MVKKAMNEDEYKTVGEVLKQARLAQKLSIEKVSDKIRIGTEYLNAIEDNNFGVLPGEVYASGFVRTYAKFLGLDAGAIYDQYRDESVGKTRRVNISMKEPEKEGGVPRKKEILIAVGALIFIYALWSIFAGGSSKNEQAVLENEAVDTQEEMVLSVPAPAVEAKVASASASSSAPAAKNAGKSVMLAGGARANAPKTARAESAALEADAGDTEMAAVPVSSVNTGRVFGATAPSRAVLVANAEVWVQVEQDGRNLISRVLNKGDRYNVPDDEYNLYLRAGNAGALDVYVDGKKLEPLGKRGDIVRSEAIDADSLLDRFE